MACSTDSACTAGRAGARVGAGSLPAGTSLIAVRARRNPSDVRRGRRIGSPRTAWTPGRIRSPAPAGATGDRARPAHRRPRRPAGDRPGTGRPRRRDSRAPWASGPAADPGGTDGSGRARRSARRRAGRGFRPGPGSGVARLADSGAAGPGQGPALTRRRPCPGPARVRALTPTRPAHPSPCPGGHRRSGRSRSRKGGAIASRAAAPGRRSAVLGRCRPPGPYPGAGVRRGLPAVRAEPCGGLGS